MNALHVSQIIQFCQLKYAMNYHFTFGSPIKTDNNIKEPQFLNQAMKGSSKEGNSFDNQQTNSHSKARKKFMKIYSQPNHDPNYIRIKLPPEQHKAIVETGQNNNCTKLCRWFEGNKNEDLVDFGYTSQVRSKSPDSRPQKLARIETPVNDLVELEELQNSHQIHYLRPSVSPKR